MIEKFSLTPLAETSARGSLFEGGMWTAFSLFSLNKVKDAFSGKVHKEPELINRKISAISFFLGNATNTVNWFMERLGYRLLFSGLPALGILANVIYVPYYASSAFSSGRRLLKADKMDEMIAKIAQPQEKPIGSEKSRAAVGFIANLSFMAYAISATAATITEGVVVAELSATFLVIFSTCTIFLVIDLYYNYEKLEAINKLQERLIEVLH